MPLSYTLRAYFNVNYSLMARLIQRFTKDKHVAEGYVILSIALTTIAFVAGSYIAWAFVEPVIVADTTNRAAELYFLGQVIAGMLAFACTSLGFKPALSVHMDSDGLLIQEGKRVLDTPIRQMQSVSLISPVQYHRHYRKYRNTRSFLRRDMGDLILIETAAGPVILSAPPQKRTLLLNNLHSTFSLQPTIPLAYVA